VTTLLLFTLFWCDLGFVGFQAEASGKVPSPLPSKTCVASPLSKARSIIPSPSKSEAAANLAKSNPIDRLDSALKRSIAVAK
jgi:hypothetical protein